MDTSEHSIQGLFAQLGLSNSDDAIEAFIANNHLPKDIPLANAAFWSNAQAQFIREALDQDAEWSEAVDYLDARLRR